MKNNDIFTKTKKQLIKTYILVVGGFMLLLSVLIFSYFTVTTYKNVDSDITSEYQNIMMQMQNTSYMRPIELRDPKDMVYVYSEKRIIYYTRNEYFGEILPSVENKKERELFTYQKNGFNFRILDIVNGKYNVQVIRNIDSELGARNQLMWTLLMAAVFSMILTYFVAVYLTKKALVPIEDVWDNQAKFIQDASHELRTPITIVSSKLEGMLKHPNNTVNDEVEKIAIAMGETRKIKKMVSDLLDLSKADAVISLHVEQIEAIGFLNEICEDYEDIAQMQGKRFELTSDCDKIDITTDKAELEKLIKIFIDNAFKYTSADDVITMKIEEDKFDGFASVSISDTGYGIKKEEIPHIFDRFFRSENVRDKDIDGSGIGLSIAKLLADNLYIDIKVDSQFGIGTTFKLEIPIQSNFLGK
ncbi:MAG: HAMP domain-containing histidine kinase [Clostridioides sp.]|nr:HAMP domain-containing histidine kinase [Clostridioides sp.]